MEAQRRKLEMDKLAELAELRQKEELRRFGERLDAFLRQRRVKREFSQDNSIDEIRARIEDLEHAAQVLVTNTEQQAKLARELLTKKQAEHHVVAKKQLIQHKHDADLLSLMKKKVDLMLSKAKADAKKVYKDSNHGYIPTDPKPAADAAPAPAPAAAPSPAAKADAALLEETSAEEATADEEEVTSDAAFISLSEDVESESESEQQIMVDAQGTPVLPTSENVDLNAPLDAAMVTVPKSDAEVAAASESEADRTQEAPLEYPRFNAAAAADEEESTEDSSAEEFGSVSPVEQAEIPTPRFQAVESAAAADAESFQPEIDAESQLEQLPLEAELV